MLHDKCLFREEIYGAAKGLLGLYCPCGIVCKKQHVMCCAGSDDGHVWIYATDTGRPLVALAADQDVVNAVQVCHDPTPGPCFRHISMPSAVSRSSASSTRGEPYLPWVVQAHPHLPVLATSGIEPTIKIWSPGEERLPDPMELVQSMKRNQVPSPSCDVVHLLHVRLCACGGACMRVRVRHIGVFHCCSLCSDEIKEQVAVCRSA